jgi:hypothetical protein
MQHSAEAEPSEGTALTCGCEEGLVVLLCQRGKRRLEQRTPSSVRAGGSRRSTYAPGRRRRAPTRRAASGRRSGR